MAIGAWFRGKLLAVIFRDELLQKASGALHPELGAEGVTRECVSAPCCEGDSQKERQKKEHRLIIMTGRSGPSASAVTRETLSSNALSSAELLDLDLSKMLDSEFLSQHHVDGDIVNEDKCERFFSHAWHSKMKHF